MVSVYLQTARACITLIRLAVAASDLLPRRVSSAAHQLSIRARVGYWTSADQCASTAHNVLCSIGSLTTLKHLRLQLSSVQADDVRQLTGLINLQMADLRIQVPQYPQPEARSLTVEDVTVLCVATQLTALRLAGLAGTGSDNPLAMAQLKGLAMLQSLNLGTDFTMDDVSFSAICHLASLTLLCAGLAL